MTCLVHNSRYRSLFHAVVNELRNEQATPASVLRNMPRKCCTCDVIDKLILVSVLIKDKEKLNNLKKLADQVDQDKQSNPKLILALNRLENILHENRGDPPSNVPVTVDRKRSTSSSDSDESCSMDTDTRRSRKPKKPAKPLKTGTFLFLPYRFDDKLPRSDQKRQRGRFIGRNGYIASVEKQHDVYVNMITSSTSEQIKKTLCNAKERTGNVTIHNHDDIAEEEDGEWLLVRSKKKGDEANTTDLETLLNDLQDRWESFLHIKKRRNEEDDHQERPNKKK